MKKLKLVNLENIDHIVHPDDFEPITLNSPAKMIFTDFKEVNPLVIEANTKAIDALNLMMKAHVHLKMVVSNKNDFVGIISSLEVSEQSIMRKISLGSAREDILVSDLMTPRNKVMAFDISELEHATVDDVVNTLKQNDLRHYLVMDGKNHHIRGVISSSDIARKLRIPIQTSSNVTFEKLFKNMGVNSYELHH